MKRTILLIALIIAIVGLMAATRNQPTKQNNPRNIIEQVENIANTCASQELENTA